MAADDLTPSGLYAGTETGQIFYSRDDGDNWEVVSSPEAHPAVVEAIAALGVEPDTAQVLMLPQNYVKLEGQQARQMLKLMESLEDHDDTKHVWSNFDIEEAEIEASLA